MDRREFLSTTTAAVGATLATQTVVGAKDEKQPVRVDTHLHCFAGNKDKRFPYHARAPYRPDTAATPEDLLRCMDGAGVSYAVVVHRSSQRRRSSKDTRRERCAVDGV